MRKTARPPAAVGPISVRILIIGCACMDFNARLADCSAPERGRRNQKLTSALASQTPVSSTIPEGDLRVNVPAAVTDLSRGEKVPAPLISNVLPLASLATAGQASALVRSTQKSGSDKKTCKFREGSCARSRLAAKVSPKASARVPWMLSKGADVRNDVASFPPFPQAKDCHSMVYAQQIRFTGCALIATPARGRHGGLLFVAVETPTPAPLHFLGQIGTQWIATAAACCGPSPTPYYPRRFEVVHFGMPGSSHQEKTKDLRLGWVRGCSSACQRKKFFFPLRIHLAWDRPQTNL